MKNFTLLLLFILTLNINANSQDIKFEFQTGIGTYSMDGLKNLVDDNHKTIPFDTKVVSDFPPYLYFRPSVSIKLNNFRIGLIYTFQSTGSRVSATDYSGEYCFDMKVKSSNPGIYGELTIAEEKIYKISLYSSIGIEFSKLETRYYLSLFDTDMANEASYFKALNYFFEPGINFTHPFKSVSIGLNLGYMIQFGNQSFYEVNNKENTLFDPVNQVPVKPNWNGIRAGLSVAFSFSTAVKDSQSGY